MCTDCSIMAKNETSYHLGSRTTFLHFHFIPERELGQNSEHLSIIHPIKQS